MNRTRGQTSPSNPETQTQPRNSGEPNQQQRGLPPEGRIRNKQAVNRAGKAVSTAAASSQLTLAKNKPRPGGSRLEPPRFLHFICPVLTFLPQLGPSTSDGIKPNLRAAKAQRSQCCCQPASSLPPGFPPAPTHTNRAGESSGTLQPPWPGSGARSAARGVVLTRRMDRDSGLLS